MAEIIALLRNEHAIMRSQLRMLAMAGIVDGEPQADIYARLSSMIRLHSHFEEDVLYPMLAHCRDYVDVVTAAYLDHDHVNQLMSEARCVDPRGARWGILLKDLEACLDHHITIEEAIVMPELEVVIDAERRHDLGQRYEEWSWTSVVGLQPPSQVPRFAERANPPANQAPGIGRDGAQGVLHSPMRGMG